MIQSEMTLELVFVAQLETLGYELLNIHEEEDFIANFKKQIEKFNAKELNNTVLSDKEFQKILNHLNKGNRFQKASNLRDRFLLIRDDETRIYIIFLNTVKWCQNFYQVARQIRIKGAYGNRYDVTLLINGLPLVQIELKKRGMELKEAFNQINRYRIHSYPNTLFEHIQIFIISNGVNTKYFANNPDQNFEKTFFWTDEHNNKISNLSEFTDIFLEPCHLSKIISKYIVLSKNKMMPMVLRPYQYYAVEKIIERAENSFENGYIWHTTGSGKTLTSFKAAQVLKDMPDIKKVLFIVDRKDLDAQTVEEFNKFAPGSVDSTENTKTLVNQLKDKDVKLIVTTIQKLDLAVTKEYHNQHFEYLKNEKVVIIFDECHRSQFGKIHADIKRFFDKAQLFGFTGTPILEKNCVGGVTTTAVFNKCLHTYLITDAISDGNALGFAVEYIGNYTKKEGGIFNENIEVDINKKEILESEKRIEKVVDYILSIHQKKTKGIFNAILTVSSIEALKKYYNFFKIKNHNLKIAAIFTFQANEEKEDVLDLDVLAEGNENKLSRDYLEDCIKDYNEIFQTNFSTDIFYKYYEDVQKKVKGRQIDLLIVVNMLLTGFDAQTLNTLYVDKNLRFHGLVQAYSRTNRIFNEKKPYGNIVCFRDLKANTDEALELFGDKNAKDIVFKEPYEKQRSKFNDAVSALKKLVPTIDDIDDLKSESDKIKFVKLFREVMRLKSYLESYVEFNFDDIDLKEQEYFDYQSKYLDIYEKRKDPDAKTGGEINDIDFLLELVRQDIINYDYIVNLLSNLKKKEKSSPEEYAKDKEDFLVKLTRDMNYKPKEPFIKRFIESYMPYIKEKDVKKEFDNFWEREKHGFIDKIADEENLDTEKFRKLINESIYTEKLPLGDSIIETLKEEPTIKKRIEIIKRVKEKIIEFGAVFERW
ncbi:MAG: type I restriction endonuclease subunit R [bacterium]